MAAKAMAALHPDKRSPADVYAKMTVGAVVFTVIFELGYFSQIRPPFDALGYLIGRDFVNTWMGARAALAGDPKPWFDFATYNAALQHLFGAHFPAHGWSYPPHLLLLTWPFGFLPYLAAYAIWCALGFALYMNVAGRDERRFERVLMLALSPAVVINVFAGQNGFFTAALLIGGLNLVDRRPLISGILFGFLTLKPQLGLLLPLMLALTARWRCIASAGLTTLALAAATSLVFGADVWATYFRDAVPMQQGVLTHGTGIFLPMMPTAFMNARIAGLPLEWAWTLQGGMSAAAIAAVTWTFWRRRDPVLSIALFVTASFLVTPYAFNYDMVVFGWVLAQVRSHEGTAALDDRLAMAVWTLPVTTMLLGLASIPISCLVLVAFAARLVWRMARVERAQDGANAVFGLVGNPLPL
jgi:hypothetical protein